jgi:hypothetical protein
MMNNEQPQESGLWDSPLGALLTGLNHSYQTIKQDMTTSPFDRDNQFLSTMLQFMAMPGTGKVTSPLWDSLRVLRPRGTNMPLQGIKAPPVQSPLPQALNPRDAALNATEQAMQQKLPVAGRSFQTATDVARRAAGETLPEHGTTFPDVPRQPTSGQQGLDFFNMLLEALGLPRR